VSQQIEKWLFSRKESAYALGVSTRSVDYLIQQRKLETRRVGAKVLVTRESLRRFAAGDHPEPIRPHEKIDVA
jgi:hypothetical protein